MNTRTLLLTLGLATVAAGTLIGTAVLLGDGPAGAPASIAEIDAETPGLLPMPELDADGMWTADFYRPSTGDLVRDSAAATAEGKLLVVMWERRGCEFCMLLHTKTLRIPAMHDYLADKFYVVRYNFYGEKPLRDIDGQMLTEEQVAQRHRAQGTPTMEFRTAEGKEVLRIPGLIEVPVMEAVFDYVLTGTYKQMNVNEYLRSKNLLL
jgi:thioredoxin-related protein